MFRIAPLAIAFTFAALSFAQQALANDNIERQLPAVRIDLAAGQPGIAKAGSKIVWTRYANLKRRQPIDFFATAKGGDFVMRMLDPRGQVLFDAVPVPKQTNPATKTYTYGFHYEAAQKGRYQIQFIADAKSRLRVTSDGYLMKVAKVSLPGTWALDYETLAWDVLNRKGESAANLERMAKALAKKVSVSLTLRTNGTFSSVVRNGRSSVKNTGRWSHRGGQVTFTTLTENGTAFEPKDQKKERAEFIDGQIVLTKAASGGPFDMHLDKQS